MRIIEKIKEFILVNKEINKYVFYSKDIPIQIKNYLIQENMLYSPIRGIYILKKSDIYSSEEVLKHKNTIISMLGGIISGSSAIAYYRGNFNDLLKYKLINPSKNFDTYIGEGKKISVQFTASKTKRKTKKIKIGSNIFEIESLLSVIINDSSILEKESGIEKLLSLEEINQKIIDNYIKEGFKISGLSKLALFYQNHGYQDKYNTIKQSLDSHGKRLDTRGTTGIQKHQSKSKKITKKIDLNSLL